MPHAHVFNARTFNPLRLDPTHTQSTRRAFTIELNKAFRALKQAVKEFMITQDALGLIERQPFAFNAQPRQYEFATSDQKLKAFNQWFKQQVDANILSPDAGTPAGQPWLTEYVQSAYKRGQLNAFLSAKKISKTDQTSASFLRQSFNQPETLSKIQLLATRTYEQLNGVTAQMGGEMNRILASGIANGEGPEAIAKEMADRIDISNTRALTIARTEVIYAHAEGQLDAFDELNVDELGVKAEWATAGDDRVCPECEDMEGEVFTVDEARGLIPLHPNCRCSWIPAT